MFRDIFKKINKPKSVYFFTLHKSASTLFGNLVLNNTGALTHVDYAAKIYQGELSEPLVFERSGSIYGPIRISRGDANPESRPLIEPCLRPEFLRNKKCLLFIRDPRDVLVSFFYSEAYSHGISIVPEIACGQLKRREEALTLGIDDYCLQLAPIMLGNYTAIIDIQKVCQQYLLLKYEDMVWDFPSFSSKLSSFIKLKNGIIEKLYEQSRPLEKEDMNSHKRSGLPGGYQNKLNRKTIAFVNDLFKQTLDHFNYEYYPKNAE